MTLSVELVDQVRQRAGFACEYCGVTETDVGGQLTVDHFRPQALGGTDDLGNLLYCCHRCNLYKADYWPTTPSDPVLWNPRRETAADHVFLMVDGTLYPTTTVGRFTLNRLRLNRPPLVAHRVRQQSQTDEFRLLARYRELVGLLEQMNRQQAALLEEHHVLLREQRALLKMLLKNRE